MVIGQSTSLVLKPMMMSSNHRRTSKAEQQQAVFWAILILHCKSESLLNSHKEETSQHTIALQVTCSAAVLNEEQEHRRA
jgi:hypothetical protein